MKIFEESVNVIQIYDMEGIGWVYVHYWIYRTSLIKLYHASLWWAYIFFNEFNKFSNEPTQV
jgi:hypothetical protein